MSSGPSGHSGQETISGVFDNIRKLEAEEASSATKEKAHKIEVTKVSAEDQKGLNRRLRKNAQSRLRAAKLRQKIHEVKIKPEETKSEEEIHVLQKFEARRRRKNERSRERTIEKKNEIERILVLPEEIRTEKERETLMKAIRVKEKKNRGDRLRRERLKLMGLISGKESSTRGRPKKRNFLPLHQKTETSPISESGQPSVATTSPVQTSLISHGQPNITSPAGFAPPLLVPILPKRMGIPRAAFPTPPLAHLPLVLAPSQRPTPHHLVPTSQLISHQLQMSSFHLGFLQSVGSSQSPLLLPVPQPQPNFALCRTNSNIFENGKTDINILENKNDVVDVTSDDNEAAHVNISDDGKDEEDYVVKKMEEV